MRTVHLVTHPESTHHVEGLVGGWHDSALTVSGLDAAERIGVALRSRIPTDVPISLHASDLLRTRQTAEAVGRHLGVAATSEPGLREMSYGVAEGRPQAWLDEHLVPPPARGERLRHDQGVPGAETRLQLAERVYAVMQRVLAVDVSHQVVVTHGFAATFVISSWIGLPLNDAGHVSFPVASGSITELHQDDRFHSRAVRRLGDTRHLALVQQAPDNPRISTRVTRPD